MRQPPPPPERFREFFSYDPETGGRWWRERLPEMFSVGRITGMRAVGAQQRYADIWNQKWAWKPAFVTPGPNGYLVGRIGDRLFLAHRAVYAWMNGCWPAHHIDHKDGDKTNLRWANLRDANPSQQAWNKDSHQKKRIFPKGVSLRCDGKAYIARIQVRGEYIHLGSFATAEEAHFAYLKAAEQYHGEFAYHVSRIFTTPPPVRQS